MRKPRSSRPFLVLERTCKKRLKTYARPEYEIAGVIADLERQH